MRPLIKQIDTDIGKQALGYGDSGEKISDFVLRGKPGSAAEKYAQSNGFSFIPS